MKAKIDTLVMNTWDAFQAYIVDIYGEGFFEVATDDRMSWEYEDFLNNHFSKN